MTVIWLIIFSFLVLTGFVFVILPILPSVPYMFLVAIIYNLISGRISQNELITLGALAIISIIIDYASGLLGARWGGASGKSLLAGMIGMLLGTFIWPIFGGFIGLFLGVLVAEAMLFSSNQKALKAAYSSLVGSVLGMVANGLLCLVFFILFLIFALTV